jgi:hypothetical protein
MGAFYSDISIDDVYGDLYDRTGKGAVPYAVSLGYKPIEGDPADDVDDFRLPKEGEIYLTPDGKIATKEKGDKGPYGPRLIVVEDLTESERTYGRGIKTGEDALSKVVRASIPALEAVGRSRSDATKMDDPNQWEVVEFRKLRDGETCAFITPHRALRKSRLWIYGTLNGEQNYEAEGKPVYIVRPKQPRKKRVLVFDYEEVAAAMKTLLDNPPAGIKQGFFVTSPGGDSIWLSGTVEEREA